MMVMIIGINAALCSGDHGRQIPHDRQHGCGERDIVDNCGSYGRHPQDYENGHHEAALVVGNGSGHHQDL